MEEDAESRADTVLDADVLNEQEIPEGVDWFLLEKILNFVELGIPITLTLNVSGATVSGVCISARQYMDELLSVFKKIYSKLGDDVATKLIEISKEEYPSPEEILERGQITRNYLHLVDARIVAPGGSPIPYNEGMLWRGKISSVDGFAIGQISPSKD